MKSVLNGIVIKEISTGDKNKIIHILTDKKGVISAYAKNAKSLKNPLMNATSFLSFSEFTVYKSGSIYIIDNACVIKIFSHLNETIEKISLIMYFCQIVDFLIPKEENSEILLSFFLNSIFMIQNDKLYLNQIKFIFELKIMCILGYTPNFNGCFLCGFNDINKYYFDIKNGNLVCLNCFKKNNNDYLYYLNQSMIKSFIYVITSDFKNIFSFKIPDNISNSLTFITQKFLCYQTDRNFSSLDFYNSLL